MGQLRLLVVRDDISGGRRHHGHQLRACLNILADAQRPVAHHAVGRGDDRGVGQVQPGLRLHRPGMGEVRLGRGELGGQDVDLLGDVGERWRYRG